MKCEISGNNEMTASALEEAADWFDRVDELTQKEHQDFAEWLNSDANKCAFKKIASAMGQPELHARVRALSQAQKPYEPSKKPEKKPQGFSAYLSIATAASLLIVALCFAGYNFTSPTAAGSNKWVSVPASASENRAQVITTGIAQEKTNILQDGSIVYQSGNSQLNVAFSDEKREVTLTKGQAYFDVTHAPEKPFVVDVESATITVVGTSFDVDRVGSSTQINVYDGIVKVEADRLVMLHKGEQATLIDGVIQKTSRFHPQQLPSWRTGWIEVEDEPIGRVIARLNRYSKKPLAYLGDPSVSVSGRFNLKSTHASVELISLATGLAIEELESRYVIRSAQ